MRPIRRQGVMEMFVVGRQSVRFAMEHEPRVPADPSNLR
jgi:hypothetical protein